MDIEICKKYCGIDIKHFVCVQVPNAYKNEDRELFCFYDVKRQVFHIHCQFDLVDREEIDDTYSFKIKNTKVCYCDRGFELEHKIFELSEENDERRENGISRKVRT